MKILRGFLVVQCLFSFTLNNSFALAGITGPKIGDNPPPLDLSRIIQGSKLGEVNWEKLKGKVVVLEFWSTQCAGCVAAIPHLNELVDQFIQKPVVFLSVTDENGDAVKSFLKRKPIKGWIAEDGSLSATRTAFDVQAIPHTVIVDASGKIVAITRPSQLKAQHLEEVLAGKPCSLPPPKPYSPEDGDVVISPNLVPQTIEVSIAGPFPQLNGAFNSRGWEKSRCSFKAEKAYLRNALADFFGVSSKLVFEKMNLPGGLYDFSASAPPGKMPELKTKVAETFKSKFAIDVYSENRVVEVYVMTIVSTNAPGLKPETKFGGGGGKPGGFMLHGSKMDKIASMMEDYLDKPIVNETGSEGLWGADLKWKMSKAELDQDADPTPDAVIEAAREQLGLELKSVKRRLLVLEVDSENKQE